MRRRIQVLFAAALSAAVSVTLPFSPAARADSSCALDPGVAKAQQLVSERSQEILSQLNAMNKELPALQTAEDQLNNKSSMLKTGKYAALGIVVGALVAVAAPLVGLGAGATVASLGVAEAAAEGTAAETALLTSSDLLGMLTNSINGAIAVMGAANDGTSAQLSPTLNDPWEFYQGRVMGDLSQVPTHTRTLADVESDVQNTVAAYQSGYTAIQSDYISALGTYTKQESQNPTFLQILKNFALSTNPLYDDTQVVKSNDPTAEKAAVITFLTTDAPLSLGYATFHLIGDLKNWDPNQEQEGVISLGMAELQRQLALYSQELDFLNEMNGWLSTFYKSGDAANCHSPALSSDTKKNVPPAGANNSDDSGDNPASAAK